jgi:endo-1,4-beta-D-glucanase Y
MDTHNTENVACVSEAIGFGLLITVLENDRESFNKLYKFYTKYLNSNGLMSWRVNQQFQVSSGDSGSATDGDLDAAYALLIAGKKFNNAEYTRSGLTVCEALYKHCINKVLYTPTLGDWVSNDSQYITGTRPSDFMLTHFQLFALEDTQRSREWGLVISSITKLLVDQLKYSKNGLVADFLSYDSSIQQFKPVGPNYLEAEGDQHYNWNSCRYPLRVGTYLMLNPNNTQLKTALLPLFNFFSSQNDSVKMGYKINGEPLSQWASLAFTAPHLILAHSFDKSKVKKIEDIMQSQSNDYYADSIACICLAQSRYILSTTIQPPVIQPPVIQPPVIQPPVIQPPVIQPPVIQPPVIQPPVIQPGKTTSYSGIINLSIKIKDFKVSFGY